MNRIVKIIQCKVVRSIPLTHKTCEQGQRKRANSQFPLGKTVRGQNAQTAHLNDKVRSDLDVSFGWHKFDEEAAKGQFLDFWA
ncbi:MAG: hypothetical protein ACYS30_09405 [Planctomycetota bacterium]